MAEIARLRKVSRAAVNDFLKTNKIPPAGKKGKLPLYDCSREPLASYLAGKKKPPEKTAPLKPEKKAAPPEKKKPPKNTKKYELPLNDILAMNIGEGGKISAAFYNEALQMARENKDATLIFKLAAAADKEAKDETIREQMRLTEQAKEKIALEQAEKLRIENDIRRGGYIELKKVKILYGRICAIHSGILMPLSLKLSSMLATVPEGKEKEITMRKLIDSEIYAALGSIQKLVVDFIDGGKKE